jgi:prolyl-tRNA synthetase
MDEPKARLGATLADIELMGIPHRFVVGDRGLEKGCVEYANRASGEAQDIALGEIRQQLDRASMQ